jgi:hypothetical protein
MPGPDGEQTRDKRQCDISASLQDAAFAHQVERLQAERREGRKTAAYSNHDKGAQAERGDRAPARPGESRKEPDHERPDDVDQYRAPGKLRPQEFRYERGESEPRNPAQRRAERHQQASNNHH